MINYPTSLDTLSNPSAIDALNNVTTPHADQHGNLNDIVEALEAKVGVNSSAVTTSHDYKLSAVTSTAKALTSGTSTQSVTNLTLVTPTLTIGSDATGDIYYRNSGGTISKLAIGTTGQVVAAGAGGTPEYTTIAANQDASTTVKGAVELATTAEINAGTATGATGAALVVTPDQLITSNYITNASLKFGGTGSDGALTISSGTTNIDCGGATFLIKNYTSISITGTGKLTFSNPATTGTKIILKSQGNVTLTSSQTPMIDVTSMGAESGAAVTAVGGTSGNAGTQALSYMSSNSAGGGGTTASGGAGGAIPTLFFPTTTFNATLQKYAFIPIASGSGSGAVETANGAVTGTSGAGGRPGGTLIIECAGYWNFTTTNGISVAGQNGGTGVGGTSNTTYPNAGGGAGGSGGYFLGLYNFLTANSGSVTVTGGTGGNSDSFASLSARSGGGSGSLITAGTAGTKTGTTSAKTGADGLTGISLITENTDFL